MNEHCALCVCICERVSTWVLVSERCAMFIGSLEYDICSPFKEVTPKALPYYTGSRHNRT